MLGSLNNTGRKSVAIPEEKVKVTPVAKTTPI